MTYTGEKETYEDYGIFCTTHREFESYGIPLQYCICLKTANIEEAKEKKKKFDESMNPKSDVNQAIKLFDIVGEIKDRHGIGCDCGFCECLRKARAEDKIKNSHWVLHGGESYTNGSLINSFETEEDAKKELDRIRGDYNITRVDGKWME